MATRKGNDLETSFRADFSIDPSIDVLTLMAAAIKVASSTRPLEFSNRMDRVLKRLNMITGPIQVKECTSCTAAADGNLKNKIRNKSDRPQELVKEDDDQKNESPKRSDGHLCTEKGDHDEDDEEKKKKLSLEQRKRKIIQQAVGFDGICQRKRKIIRVLGVAKDVPRTRVRLVH